ncbi:MAG: S-adenosyl-l-methionine hydroxide adenosyltransferase family protein [Steroidobacteraceae bacterium]
MSHSLKPFLACVLFTGLTIGSVVTAANAPAPLVLMSDFGTRDGAVAAMKGVAYSVSQKLLVADLSHDNNDGIFAGAYRLYQAEEFWPAGSVFVTVIDPGVGTQRLSVVLKTRNGHFFVGPNNGLMTFVAEQDGIEELRQIDEKVNRRPGSENSHTFHGRDVFAYTGARLAAGIISFEQVGPKLPAQQLISIAYRKRAIAAGKVTGIIPVLDVQYGNVWTNIPQALFEQLHIVHGDSVHLRIYHGEKLVDEVRAPYRKTFGDVPIGAPVIYINSLLNVALALNQGDYAAAHKVGSGVDWSVEIRKE